MAHAYFKLEIDGEEVDEQFYRDLNSLEVELDDELASMFRLSITLAQQPDGTWAYLDEEQLRVWKPVTISAGFGRELEEVMTGYITQIKPLFDADPARCTLEVWGMDGTVLMDRQEQLKAWPNQKDSDIADAIFKDHHFTAVVKPTSIVHDVALSTIIQRETDIQFLRRLAQRNGYECYVQGKFGYFRPPQLAAAPQPVLAAYSRDKTNLLRFALEVNALTPTNVSMEQMDRVNKAVVPAQADTSQQPTLGALTAADLLVPGVKPGLLFVSRNVTTGVPEMTALVQELYHQAEWFVTGEGEINANAYGHVLLPRRTVTIKGVGESYSGVYYVTHVTHTFTADGYTQQFKVKRNALMRKGDEQFASEEGLF